MQGLPAPTVTRRRRGLLPRVFILTRRWTRGPFRPLPNGGQLFSVALSV